AALAWGPRRGLLRRPGGCLPGPGVADRTVRGPAPLGPHGAAPAAHDGGAAAAVAGRAAVPFTSGLATTHPRFLGRPLAVRAALSPALRPPDAPADGALSFRRRHLVLARATGLRPGPALGRLALPGARLLPRHGPAVLVSRRPALPRPAALVALAPVAGPAPG